ncbi:MULTISPECIES: acyltransferase [unclassified Methanosarcina]|uniref:acyltransferase family protein n=1 Tax=unclassified Methanosarcina TaxID=2644672 RepID=UPI0006161732|nr:MULTISPECIES: acyltransferase [unclassified Methanosarcina]AKB19461.1 acyltransferase, putative [Methanosarcina sp. WWM596]AKB22717.1 acyltransferase, putative [Methanosarcina sp. WH1]
MAGKITYLDGLRGIAAVNVMIMHFFVALAPAMAYGTELPSHFGNLDKLFSGTPLGLIGAGNFSVCIFFVLSGYVLTQKYFKTKENGVIISSAVRRYLRLFIPVFASVMLSYLLASAGLYRYYLETMVISAGSNYRDYWAFTPDIVEAVKQALWGSFFVGGKMSYNPVLWTMKIEFFGSMFVFAMALLFGSLRNRWTFYLAAIVLFHNSYYLAFTIGMVFADTFNNKTPEFKKGNQIILSIVLILGLFLGSYPMSPVKADSLYSFLNTGFFKTPTVTYHIIGAGMIMYALLNSRRMQNFFSSPVPVFLGKISYSLYLVHFLVISSFTCAVFLALYPVLPYGAAVLISCFLSLFIIIPLSYLFYKYVDTTGVELSKLFYNWLVSSCGRGGAEHMKQEHLSSAIFTIYNKFFK